MAELACWRKSRLLAQPLGFLWQKNVQPLHVAGAKQARHSELMAFHESWSWRLKPAATRGQQSQRLGHSPVPRPWSRPGAERGSREGRGRTRRRPCACQAAHAQPLIWSGVLHPLFWGVLRGSGALSASPVSLRGLGRHLPRPPGARCPLWAGSGGLVSF